MCRTSNDLFVLFPAFPPVDCSAVYSHHLLLSDECRRKVSNLLGIQTRVCLRNLMPSSIVLLLIIGPFAHLITPDASVETETKKVGFGNPFDGLSPAQHLSLDELLPTMNVQGPDGTELNTLVNLEWIKRAGSTGPDKGAGIATDSLGNAFVVGSLNTLPRSMVHSDINGSEFWDVSFDQHDTTQDMFVGKMSPEGEWLWVEKVGGINHSYVGGRDIAVDSSDNAYVTGWLFVDLGEEVSFGSTSITHAEYAFVAKIDSNGDWLWVVTAESPATGITLGGRDGGFGASIEVDSQGNVYVSGEYGYWISFNDTLLMISIDPDTGIPVWEERGYFVAKIDPSGNWLWATAGPTLSNLSWCCGDYAGYWNWQDYMHAWGDIAVDPSNNVYLTGMFNGNPQTIGEHTLSSAGSYDVFVGKVDSDGNWLWLESAGSTGFEAGFGIVADSSGNAYVTGAFNGPELSFGDISLESVNETSIFVAKIDAGGNWSWAESAVSSGSKLDANTSDDIFMVDRGLAIDIDPDGEVYVMGDFRSSTVEFGDYAVNSHPVSGSDVFVARISPEGVWLMATSFGGGHNELGGDLAIDHYGNVILTGKFRSHGCKQGYQGPDCPGVNPTDSFDQEGSCGDYGWYCGGGDIFVAKYTVDTDGDGLSNYDEEEEHGTSIYQTDSDGDGFSDFEEVIWYGSNPLLTDSDGDGFGDFEEVECGSDPTLATDIPVHSDSDGVCDTLDLDDDDDGYADPWDAFPKDATETSDNDGDGVGDNADNDDDNDGWSDSDEANCNSNPNYATLVPIDLDGDGVCDLIDLDDDGDGWSDSDEANCSSDPNNAALVPIDLDGDRVCDLVDLDDDGDGVNDTADDCPLGQTGWTSNPVNDVDGDGCHNTEDYDDDGDGVGDAET